MNVLNVNAVIDPVIGGGTAERTLQMTRSLISAGFHCEIMTTDIGISNNDSYMSDNYGIHAFRCINKRFYVPYVSYNEIKRIVGRFDVIHIMGHWTILNVLAYLAARSLNIPYVVCPAGALPIYGRSRFIKKCYNILFGKKIIQNANAWIAITEDEKYDFVEYSIDKDHIVVIPNGVNPDDFLYANNHEFRLSKNIHGNKFILFMGRLNSIKGPDILLDAYIKGYKDWDGWDLVFAGPDGGLLNELKVAVEKNNLKQKVHFIGYVGGKEKSSAYHAADVLVIPSRHEAMSIVVLEAGIFATPVVLTDQCGFNVISDIGGGLVSEALDRWHS